MIRIVGLSATLPDYLEVFLATNIMCRIPFLLDVGLSIHSLCYVLSEYDQVAQFLWVNFETILFFFDSSYRPVPSEKDYVKRTALFNSICYEKVVLVCLVWCSSSCYIYLTAHVTIDLICGTGLR